MAWKRVVAGSTSVLVEFPIYDSSSTIGALLAGLTYGSSGLTAYYYRSGASGSTSMSLATMTMGTWVTLGFVAVDGTNMPGLYQLGIPNAALASGATAVTIYLKGATNMVPVVLEIELTSAADYPVNMTQILGTAVSSPATAGILDVNLKNIANAAVSTSSAQLGVNAVNIAGQAAQLDGNNLLKVDLVDIAGSAVSTSSAQLGVNAVQIGAAVPGSATIGTVTNLTNAAGAGDLTATMKTSVTTAASAATPVATLSGDLTATMKASVTAAVPSVAAIQSGLPTDASVQTDLYTVLSATAFTDATSLTANSLLDRIRALGWIVRNQISVTDSSGAGTIYKDDSSTTAFSVSLTDNATTTTRTRAA